MVGRTALRSCTQSELILYFTLIQAQQEEAGAPFFNFLNRLNLLMVNRFFMHEECDFLESWANS